MSGGAPGDAALHEILDEEQEDATGRSSARRETHVHGVSKAPSPGVCATARRALAALRDGALLRKASPDGDGVSLGFQVLILVGFVLIDVSRALGYRFALKHTAVHPQTMVVTSFVASILIASGMALKSHGLEGVQRCFNPRMILRFSLAAIFFSTAQTLDMMTNEYLEPGAIRAICQIYLPLLAILSRLILKRAYTGLQWCALVLVTLCAVLFSVLDATDPAESEGETTKNKTIGVIMCAVACTCGAVGVLFTELCMTKGSQRQVPFYIQKVQIDVGSLMIALMILFCMPVAMPSRPNLDIHSYRAELSCVTHNAFNFSDVATRLRSATQELDEALQKTKIEDSPEPISDRASQALEETLRPSKSLFGPPPRSMANVSVDALAGAEAAGFAVSPGARLPLTTSSVDESRFPVFTTGAQLSRSTIASGLGQLGQPGQTPPRGDKLARRVSERLELPRVSEDLPARSRPRNPLTSSAPAPRVGVGPVTGTVQDPPLDVLTGKTLEGRTLGASAPGTRHEIRAAETLANAKPPIRFGESTEQYRRGQNVRAGYAELIAKVTRDLAAAGKQTKARSAFAKMHWSKSKDKFDPGDPGPDECAVVCSKKECAGLREYTGRAAALDGYHSEGFVTGFWGGWDRVTVGVLLIHCSYTWFAGYVTKMLGSVTRALAMQATLVIIYLVSALVFHFPGAELEVAKSLCCGQLVLATSLYTCLPGADAKGVAAEDAKDASDKDETGEDEKGDVLPKGA